MTPEEERKADIDRAHRLISEAAKMYRLDLPNPATLQSHLDDAAELLRKLKQD